MTDVPLEPVTILGAGSWGTALALYLARRGQTVRLWSKVEQEIEDLIADKANKRYLPGYDLPAYIHPTADLAAAVDQIKDVVIVIPSAGFKDLLNELKNVLTSSARIICATKGLDEETGQLLTLSVTAVLGDERPFAVLSGPSFAREVAAGLPCAVAVATLDRSLAEDIRQRFDSPLFRLTMSDDVAGVSFGGVVKNIIAIATGISDGLNWGANARSALITQGLAEMIRLGSALGGQTETFMGLSGLGDLILTCSDDQSRNRRLGLALGKGQTVALAEQDIGQVVEGKRNAELVYKLARKHQVTMPICEAIWHIFRDDLDVRKTMQTLWKTLFDN